MVTATKAADANTGTPAEPGTIEGTLAWKPIIKGSVKLQVSFTKDGNNLRGFVVDRKNVSATTPEEANIGTLVVIDALSNKVIEGVLDVTTDNATNKPKSYIDYSSGNLKVTFASGSALLDDSSTLVDYRYDNRQVGDGAIGTNQLKVPEVSIRIDSMPVLKII